MAHEVIGAYKAQEIVRDTEGWCAAVHGVAKVRHDLVMQQQQQGPSYSTGKLETWENQWCSSSPKSGILEAHEELMFQFRSEGRKTPVLA